MRFVRFSSLHFSNACFFLLAGLPAMGMSVEPLSTDDRAARADAICRGTIESLTSYRGEDGFIRTEAVFHIRDVFKGQFPERLAFHYRGGILDGEGESVVGAPDWKTGEERVLFLARRANAHANDSVTLVGGPGGAPPATAGILAKLRALFPQPAAGEDLRELEAVDPSPAPARSTATDSATGAGAPDGLFSPPRRFILPDRGQGIPYLVDADMLPPGISLSQALEAVETALAAWADVSSARFEFEGIESFGMAANNIAIADGRLRIQLHDQHGAIPGTTVLGIGGQSYSWIDPFSDGGMGGRVGSFEFHRSNRGYVVLNHTASAMQNPKTFEAVLCHEIGHALGLAHSSEDPDEADLYLREAMMYYRIHADGRGATLGDWDEDVIAATHPADTPPPFGFDRVLRAVTSPSPLSSPEVNEIVLRGYSLHAENLSPHLYEATSNNGAFTLSGNTLTYTPGSAFSDSPELDPAGSQYFDRVYARFDDGINLSPPVHIRVIQFLLATQPAGEPDGLPNSWRDEHFGSSTPTAGFSGAHDDPDGDGQTNIDEFLLGTDPRDPASRFAVSSLETEVIAFSSRPFEIYELHASDDLVEWWPTGQVLDVDSSTGTFPVSTKESPRRFYRVIRVP